MLFCLDYDGTYSEDIEFWNIFILRAERAGHRVILATYRDRDHDLTLDLRGLELLIPVYYTKGVAKRWWLEQFANEEDRHPDVFIDDKPESLLQNSEMTKEDLKEWRKSTSLVASGMSTYR